ncbi:sulfotransferase [Peristeroidobacter agariperforans]|uniref:sulfotransferase n=1 Tax=Peristeroidobacter agariperforans TaxID=268404 RepID=UPI0013007B30|nr:sulfotransferase [Peristeroidobacter agariperforans]
MAVSPSRPNTRDYGLLDRLLHRLALGSSIVAEASFDADQAVAWRGRQAVDLNRHVFIAGLARAGTTFLMRRFHSTDQFRSLTYRDMPFVLAPNIWGRISSISRRTIQSVQRAHNDAIAVDADSPESLDEVFWRVFADHEYVSPQELRPHFPSEELVKKYVQYVSAILASQAFRPNRYLSKNNNNILRLQALRSAFPNALILIPVREPLQHAYSLLKQHRHFSSIQTTNPFVLDYMNWLAHHEFGLGHRPFAFPQTQRSTNYPPNCLNYWLERWCDTYTWLAQSKPHTSLFVFYEHLCGQSHWWIRLAKLADIPVADSFITPPTLVQHVISDLFDPELAHFASTIYARLIRSSHIDF